MDLIDWPGAARNALWIVGLSIALATLSYASWWAKLRRLQLRAVIDRSQFAAPFAAGMLLFTISLAWSAPRWWERGLWIVLALAFLWQLVTEARRAASGDASH
jgi:hypothetical protein